MKQPVRASVWLGRALPALPLVALFFSGAPVARADESESPRVRAPDFSGAKSWLNTERPLKIGDLRGQVVLLDFWTYCCINCMHVFPDLRFLEEKYKDEPLVVIGVHSGKFSQEKDPANIRKAILRHNLTHPVAVDSDYEIWNSYTVQAWPTFILIDPDGYVIGQVSGEGNRDVLDQAIAKTLKEFRERGRLAKPLRFRPERASFSSGALEFPGKVLADEKSRRLFISDTNHHRVLVADLDGQVRAIIGAGDVGLRDGGFDEARFHQPQGLALSEDGQTLYIADTENHCIRAADLAKKTVTRIAGAGTQSYDFRADGPAEKTALSSPWDLARVGERLYIAMAGTHQIWVLELAARRVRVFAGSGRETRIDTVNAAAAFAQPSGLATDGKRLFVADSEISTIRTVELRESGETGTLAGSGGLFEFGDVDGVGEAARFQHPLGVALRDETLFVADTFNHLIRAIDVKTGRVTTWLGTPRSPLSTQATSQAASQSIAGGLAVTPPEPGRFFEPGGLSIAGDTLYVADTNHHRIVAIDMATKQGRVVEVRLP